MTDTAYRSEVLRLLAELEVAISSAVTEESARVAREVSRYVRQYLCRAALAAHDTPEGE